MRTLVVADSRFVAEMIQRSLRSDPGIDVVGCADGRTSVAHEVAAAQPAAVVFDEMADPGLALRRIREARAAVPDAKLVVLIARTDHAWLTQAVDAGADAAICKTVHPTGLAVLVRAISSGVVYHSFAPPPPSEDRPAPAPAGLTRRELEVLRQVAEGAANSQIAARLCITEQTVKFHLSNVYRKLGVANRTQASRHAHVHRLLHPPFGSHPRAASEAA